MTDYLANLNSAQRQAVMHGTGTDAGPLLVIAGAGSGKTSTLAHRVAHLVYEGVDPNRILLLTFSRRAAEEMSKRSATALASFERNLRLSWAGTFHAIGARLVREYAKQTGISPSFTVLDRSDAADFMDIVRHDLELSVKEKRFPQKATCLSVYSRVANGDTELEEVLADHFPWCSEWVDELKALFRGYVEAKQRANSLDFDDLLLYWDDMMSVAELAADIGEKFDHVLVDEYQDVNGIQASILQKLKPNGQGLMAVGDDAQSIYGFRCADVRHILQFPKQYSPDAKVITLDQNFRSTQPILNASNAVIGEAKERFTKNLWTNRIAEQKPFLVAVSDLNEQAEYVADRVLEAREEGTLLRDQAVLFRASHHSAVLELELARRSIPFRKFGGLRFLDTQHVKDIVSIVRFLENPHDRVAGFRVLKILPGIGPKTAGRILDNLTKDGAHIDALKRYRPTATSAVEWEAFSNMFTMMAAGRVWPGELEVARQWYAPYLEQQKDDAKARMADLHMLCSIAENFPSRTSFLTDLAIDPPDATSDEAANPSLDEDNLVLSTIHSAKGKEWSATYILNVVDGCIPSDLGVGSESAIEEERRLLYVAMTRAKTDLHLLVPRKWHVHGQMALGDRHVLASRTRFIPDQIMHHFEQISWQGKGSQLVRPPLRTNLVDMAALSRARWS